MFVPKKDRRIRKDKSSWLHLINPFCAVLRHMHTYRIPVKLKQTAVRDLLSIAPQFQARLATEVSMNGSFCLFLQQLVSAIPLERE